MKIRAAREPGIFTLYREGVFWTCYNEDAMFFTKHIKPYKVVAKYIKGIDEYVFVVSFPEKVKEGLMTGHASMLASHPGRVAEVGPGPLQYTITAPGTKDGYEAWSAQELAKKQARESEHKPVTSKERAAHQKITDMLSRFDLANSTPMQGMQLIQHMKHILREG